MNAADRTKRLAALVGELLAIMDQYRELERTPAAQAIFERMKMVAKEIQRTIEEH